MKVLRLAQLLLGYIVLAIGVQRGRALPKVHRHASALRLRGGQSEDKAALPMVDTESVSNQSEEAAAAVETSVKPPLEHTRTFLGFGSSMSDLKSSVADRSSQVKEALKKQIEVLREKQAKINLEVDWKEQSTKAMQAVGPASVAVADWFYHDGELTFAGVYALSLLGASSGFHLFLYFITVGYACGVMLPVLATLYVSSKNPIENLTTLHSAFAVVWAIRASSFFLYREYVGWPQLHEKVVEVNQMARLNSKLFCWLVYSFFYATMVSPCLYRLKYSSSSLQASNWGVLGKMALCMQGLGLVLESVADYQKSAFKAIPGNRNQWCNVGLYKLSTFPNYLGEITFWYGTFLGGLACYKKPHEWVLASIGILFISFVIKGAVASLGAKQLRKYGDNSDFMEFRKTHTWLGPNPLAMKRHPKKSSSTPFVDSGPFMVEEEITVAGTTATTPMEPPPPPL